MQSENRKKQLSEDEKKLIKAAKEKAHLLYEGRVTPHRSCGIALAETFNLNPSSYQSLRRGGITGYGECGALVAGRLILGEIFGDPDPLGGVTDKLRSAIQDYHKICESRLVRGNAPGEDNICNTLTGQFENFISSERACFCTDLVSMVAEACAEVMVSHGITLHIKPIPDCLDSEKPQVNT
jgi:hypothetical protein